MKELVHIEDLKVVFEGFTALDIPFFSVAENELRVVIGPNGAGKTTLCDVISGKTKPVQGRLYLGEANLEGLSEEAIAQLGVGRKFQTPTLFDSLSVFENMELALPGSRGVFRNFVRGPGSRQRQLILDTLSRVGLQDLAAKEARFLSHGQRQWLEICMLIVQSPRLLLVDEPAAGLSDEETALTGRLLKELAGSHTIIVIEHDMEFVRSLQSTVTVLNEGRVLCEGSMDEVESNQAVIEAYLGR